MQEELDKRIAEIKRATQARLALAKLAEAALANYLSLVASNLSCCLTKVPAGSI